MLVAVAIVPGPPALVPQLMGSAAHELDDLRQAADLVISTIITDLVGASADSSSPGAQLLQLVIAGPGRPGEFNASGPVSFASFGRDVVVPALAAPKEGSDPEEGSDPNGGTHRKVDDRGDNCQERDGELPTPLMVARYLASRHIAAHPEHAGLWASARWIATDGTDSTLVGEQLRDVDTRVALILVADGATCHGPKAPRAEDSRAPAYHERVCAALASGKPAELARLDPDLGRELGATGPQLWPVLLAAADGAWTGEVTWSGWPYGVGWAVAPWRRDSLSSGVARA